MVSQKTGDGEVRSAPPGRGPFLCDESQGFRPGLISIRPSGAQLPLLNHAPLALLDEAHQQSYVFAFEFAHLLKRLRGVEL